ncbi:PH domain-containing protein [Alteribacter aurantiacus]|uniref:PH domain-containing protein n=1 Tax=Alteribacter aurantiacus TaxID=254410 RepID=UPI00047C9B9C|nr:PH domain-containing protein [Alteribacter aurantiacus]
MIFRSKIDTFFVKFMLLVLLIIGLASFFPIYLEGGTDLTGVLLLTSTFLIIIGFGLWGVFSIKYVFYQDYLLVQGGLSRSRIPYEYISKASPTTDIFTGYRILSSRDAIEIFYKTSVAGSVKISPREKREFITELKQRCPNAWIQTWDEDPGDSELPF